jgi:hypothetical protein
VGGVAAASLSWNGLEALSERHSLNGERAHDVIVFVAPSLFCVGGKLDFEKARWMGLFIWKVRKVLEG